MNVLSLFAGIGGFDLGLERAGMSVVAQCEIEPFCQRVLAKHWPEVPCYDDVRTLTAERLASDGIGPIDVICGGFPCQDLSRANGVWSSRPGLSGPRSGLWSEYARLIGEVRPRYVIVENVVDLVPWLGTILGDLAALGYDAEWDRLYTTVVGGRSPRERLWLVSYPCIERQKRKHGEGFSQGNSGRIFNAVARSAPQIAQRQDWLSEPPISRVVDGTPNRMDRRDRTQAVGNAVVPQIVEAIGRAIMGQEE